MRALLWFGEEKVQLKDKALNLLVRLCYNPNTWSSWWIMIQEVAQMCFFHRVARLMQGLYILSDLRMAWDLPEGTVYCCWSEGCLGFPLRFVTAMILT